MEYYITGMDDFISHSGIWGRCYLLSCIQRERNRGGLSIMVAEEIGDPLLQQIS